jgi:molybdopterin-binding protein
MGVTKREARNRITTTVTEIRRGKMMCRVKVETPAPSRTALVLDLESLKELGIIKRRDRRDDVSAVNVLLLKP